MCQVLHASGSCSGLHTEGKALVAALWLDLACSIGHALLTSRQLSSPSQKSPPLTWPNAGNTYTKVQGVVVNKVSQGTTCSQKLARLRVGRPALPHALHILKLSCLRPHHSTTLSQNLDQSRHNHRATPSCKMATDATTAQTGSCTRFGQDRHPAALQELGGDGRGVGACARAQEGDHVHLPVDRSASA